LLRRLLDSPWTYFSLAGVLFLVLIMTQFEIRPPPRPKGTAADIASLKDRKDLNLVFIVIDTLRADRLHGYGYERETSPTLDYLAQTGVRFGRVISQSSWTKSSMASLWTSTWPARNGILRWSERIPPEANMPAELLQKAGFHTAGIWRNGWVAPNFGFDQGFDTYLRPQSGRDPAQFQHHAPSTVMGTDEDLTVAAREFLNSYANQRFFLYVHYMDVHDYEERGDRYEDGVREADAAVGALLDHLKERGLFEGSVIVVTGDHGEHLGEKHPPFPNRALELHYGNPSYEELLAVPLLVSPRSALSGEPPHTTQELHAWLLRLAGAQPDPPRGAEPAADELYVSELAYRTYRRDGWKSAFDRSQDRVLLFDLAHDPNEQQDLSATRPDVVEAHRRRVDELTRELAASGARRAAISAEERARLEALGYLEPAEALKQP